MKKLIYVALVMLLGLMLSFVAHAFIEIWLIERIISEGLRPVNNTALGYGYCALPVSLKFTLLLIGIVGGFFLGERWWQIVYVEKRHWRNKNKK